MDEEPGWLDTESESVLAELWATPVGRRWVLKAGLGSAAAIAASVYAGAGVAQAAKPATTATAAAPAGLQFALGSVSGVSDLALVANGKTHSLVAHTRTSRTTLRNKGGLWEELDLAALTHYLPAVPLPTNQAMLVSVEGRRGRHQVVVAQLLYVPPQTTLALARTAHRLTGSVRSVVGHPKDLNTLGITTSEVSSPQDVVQLASVVGPPSSAVALVAMHPNIATKDATNMGVTNTVLSTITAVNTLGNAIADLQDQGLDYATRVTVTDPDGTPSKIAVPTVTDGKVVGSTTTTFSTIQLATSDSHFNSALKGAVTAGIKGVRNTHELGAVIDKPLDQDSTASTATWVQPQGVTPAPQSCSSASAPSRCSPASAPASPSPLSAAAPEIDVAVKNTGFLSGTYTETTGGYQNGAVPLKIYNNFVRWIWVYVQYLGKGNQNLSANPKASFPDSQYSKSLALLPQVFTVLGVPLWDTNTIEVTLEFPEEAHTARLLYCGLGSDVLGGGWRQYFPADAYPDHFAPTDEVLVPSLLTGILTIGLNLFALATDISIAAVWGDVKSVVLDALSGVRSTGLEDLRGILNGQVVLSASEVAAVSAVAGQTTYSDLQGSGFDLHNLWNIIVGLAGVIPKVIFNPKAAGLWYKVATALAGQEAGFKLIEAIPFIGQGLAVAAAVGDAVTLAECATESVIAPWVIENEVTLTYPATVTISHDPHDATFPKTAVSWRLEALVDGALVFDPLTGEVNSGGAIQSDPVVVTTAAPFGGSVIQWSVAFLDAGGNQVGTGVSPPLPNDDRANPPSTVSFAITEIPVPIGADTIFKRADTTTYSTAAHGYTWSDQISDTGTAGSSAIEEVSGTTVATLAGLAGMVFKQADRYYLRGVPVAENGTTIQLLSTPTEGYARRPFLLFDPFVDQRDQGNHVLLEPDETTQGYHIRKLMLDPGQGTLTWDSSLSWGMFALEVSAAALHSSGRVVAVHTDSGRLGQLLPPLTLTPRPQLAAYTAGSGGQVGLLQSPIALAVTNPGIVLVLEAEGPRVSAFDLNGNPARYFQPPAPSLPKPLALLAQAKLSRRGAAPPQLQYTMPLVSPGTYLDLAVDGANQIYALYFTGDGSDPQDYRIDVYTPNGTPLATHSAGVNVPHLAVDYWRSIYGANYNPLTDLGTRTPHIDAKLGVAEPSLSRFDPVNPKAAAPKAKKRAKPKKAARSSQ